ncbi:sensor histidine kinase [Geomobilimonas luticola]|uniref:histidine kinase n=1 Tax=Geomobilimonas luticola TaxID=1114878 RepID=A0ABS5S9R3_9BACT|nr:PAS domain-containing sensor histidine kinase [Geomobilimonas luticola]MBT0652117.1 PAS domain S-box protein [Geomobilimonas luticola]
MPESSDDMKALLEQRTKELEACEARLRTSEETFRQSERKFAKAFEATPSLLTISSLVDGRYIEVNGAFERTFKYRREEVIGRTTRELGIWEDPTDRARMVEALENHERVRDIEVRFRDKAGSTIEGLVSAEVIELGGEKCLLALTKDLTESRRSEAALHREKDFVDTVINSMPGIFYVFDEQRRMARWNRRFAEFSGRSDDEMAALDPAAVVAEEHHALLDSKLREVFTMHRDADAELLLLDRQGKKVPFYCTGSPMTADGKTYLIGVGIDITDHKRAEEKIEELNTHLAARAAELEDANQGLEAFNYTASHDLRRPLSNINGYCQIMQELCADRLDEQCRGFLQGIHDQSMRMNRLIDTLLNFSRLTRSEITREEIDLSELAMGIAYEYLQREPDHRVELTIADGVVANGDAKLVRVVLENLLGNAWKYTGKREEARIEFGVTEIEGKRTYFVRDNGAGFDMSEADNLFAPFQRLPGTEEYEGHGIGLATVERIIRRHGGRVWAEGAKGEGATFYFTL